MISSLKTDLLDLKELVFNNINNTDENVNTTEYQVDLDLLTNTPLSSNITSDELYRLYSSTNWIQSLDSDSNYKLLNISNSDIINGVEMIKNVKVQYIDYVPILTYDAYSLMGENCLNVLKRTNSKGNIITDLGDSNAVTKKIPFESKSYISGVYNDRDIIKTWFKPKSIINEFNHHSILDILDHRNYNEIMLPTSKLNYYIQKSPFVIRESKNSENIATSTHVFPKYDIKYDLIIYDDRIITISNGALSAVCNYKVFTIPTLELIESGNDIKHSIYTKLKLTRKNIIGPNVISSSLPIKSNTELNIVNIVHGFKIAHSNIYDIYMNTIRESENASIKYKNIKINGSNIFVFI